MKTAESLSEAFLQAHPDDAARLLERFAPQDVAAVLSTCLPSVASAVLQRMVSPAADDCVSLMSDEHGALVIAELPSARATELLRRMLPERRRAFLEMLPAKCAGPLGRVIQYPPHTAGALVDPLTATFPDDISVEEARDRLAGFTTHVHYYLYVVNREQTLVGVLNLRELMLGRPQALLASMMQRQVVSVPASTSREQIITNPYWQQFHALPVVDAHGVFLGVLRYDVFRRLETEAAPRDAVELALGTILAIGELYWVGLAKVLAKAGPTPKGG